MQIHVARWTALDVESNLQRMRGELPAAVTAGAELVVFPELFLTGYSRRVEPARARAVFEELSAASGSVLCVFGSISENRRNRVTVWCDGRQIAGYDKVHLFAPNGELDMWCPGDRYTAFTWRDLTIGLMNCNDVRFPEQARALRLEARCDLLVVPAWWPWRRDHIWRTLLRARAVENGVWVVGCSIAGSVFAGEDFAGAGNHVFNPAGDPVRTEDDCTYHLLVDSPPRIIVDPLQHFVAIDTVEIEDGERSQERDA